jgi:hypothetical protein
VLADETQELFRRVGAGKRPKTRARAPAQNDWHDSMAHSWKLLDQQASAES